MKLSYLQSIDPCDPLPKLGRKVDKTDIIDHASFERAESIKAFEIGEHYIKPEWLGADFAHDGTGYIEPESVVSFADAAEMAEGWIKWDGGECPCRGASVMVRYRDGGEAGPFTAGVFYGGERGASDAYWQNDGYKNDIIAYRIIKPAAEVVTESDLWDAHNRAIDRAGLARTSAVWDKISEENDCLGHLSLRPDCWPAAIAALEALR